MSIRLFSFFLAACTPAAPLLQHTSSEPVQFDATLERAVPVLRNGDHRTFGPSTSADAVWNVTRNWNEISNEAGMAWSSNSGLNWDEKYRLWIDSLGMIDAEGGGSTTDLSTPWGTVLPLNRMECAETAIMLRASFAAWHNLPFFLSGYSPALGQNVYYGHFGMVTFDGANVPWAPNFAQWQDHSASWTGGSWPDDAELEALALTAQQDDGNAFLGADAYSGAYLDEIHLNKRVGYFLLRTLTDFGSIHLAHAENLFDLEPEAVEPGDLLIHRWQAQGIGHTMVVKEVEHTWASTSIEILAGSMPRVQPHWYNAPISRSYFSHRFSGGSDISPVTGEAYVELGGGLKRWRSATFESGRWVNLVPVVDQGLFIDPDDDVALSARPEIFSDLLGAATPEDERDALLAAVEAAREALRLRPASCTNRERRERAFDDLYTHMESAFGWPREQVDAHYRELDDYIFAELEYSASPSCCWNSTTPEMYEIIHDYAQRELDVAEAAGTCVEPTLFLMQDGGYAPFEAHAASLGLGWVAWSADETCPQAGATNGVVVQEPFTPWCALPDPVDPTDPIDPPDPVDPVDPTDPSDEGGSGSGCGSNVSSQWQGLGGVFLAGIMVRRKRSR